MNKKILVIDYDKDTLDIISYILEDRCYQVVGYDCPSTLNDLSSLPDLILLDTHVNRNDEERLIKQLKSRPLTANIPVVLSSVKPGLAELAERIGADSFLNKPFDLDELLLTIELALAKCS